MFKWPWRIRYEQAVAATEVDKTHVVTITSSSYGSYKVHRATCSCGWTGADRDRHGSRSIATGDGDRHMWTVSHQ